MLHQKIAEYAVEKGKHFVVMYGQTEATARMSYLSYEKSLLKRGRMCYAEKGEDLAIGDERFGRLVTGYMACTYSLQMKSLVIK